RTVPTTQHSRFSSQSTIFQCLVPFHDAGILGIKWPMQPLELQMALWEAASRHTDLAEGVAKMAAAFRKVTPVDAVRVFSFETGGCVLAAAHPALPGPARLGRSDTEALARF